MKTLRITVNNQTYEVQVEVISQDETAAPRSQRARAASISAPSAASAPPKAVAAPVADGAVVSPLSAVVVSLDVQPGAKVSEGDKLMTLEAMKMNTFVSAPQAGTVGEFLVKPGDAVEEGQALVSLQ